MPAQPPELASPKPACSRAPLPGARSSLQRRSRLQRRGGQAEQRVRWTQNVAGPPSADCREASSRALAGWPLALGISSLFSLTYFLTLLSFTLPCSPDRRGGVERRQVLSAGSTVVLSCQALSHLHIWTLQI